MKKINKHKSAYGFTLIEMMIAIIILATLIAIALPSYKQSIRNNLLTAVSNELLSTMTFARSEAIKQAQSVTVCASTNLSACSSSSNWANGWIAFVDKNADQSRDGSDCGTGASDDCLLRVWKALKGESVLTGTTQFITFDNNGLANAASTLTLKAATSCGTNEQRIVSVTSTGRASVAQGDCP